MKKLLIYTIVIAGLVITWSCTKIIDKEPQSGKITDASYFKTKNDFQGYLFGAYAEMAGEFNGNGVANWLIVTNSLTQDMIGSDEKPKILPIYMTPNNGDIVNYWITFYKIATKSNLVLSRLPASPLSDAEKTPLEGEAKFLRGFAYFNLARAFGNIPLITTEYEVAQNTVSCTPEAQVWDQVIADLTDAAAKLPKKTAMGPGDLGRATKGAALTYLANAYMYKNDWAKAATASTDLIALGEYSLLPNVRHVFSYAYPNSAESIFEVQFQGTADGLITWQGVETGNVMPENVAPRNIGSAYAAAGGWGELIANPKLANSFDPADDRRKQLIKLPGEKYKGETMADTLLIPLTIAQNKSAFSTKYWIGPEPQSYAHGLNMPLMRFAEFKLNYAEILFKLNKSTEAYKQLNDIRQRALLPAKTVASDSLTFFNDLMNERRWELNFEPNLWFHYTRTGRAQAYLLKEHGVTMPAAWNKYPIPQIERDQNPNLCQNTGY